MAGSDNRPSLFGTISYRITIFCAVSYHIHRFPHGHIMPSLLVDATSTSSLLLWKHHKQMITTMQISRPTLKPKPTKTFKVLIIFSIFTATVSGGIHKLTSP